MAMEHLLEILQDQANLTTSQLAAMLGEKEEDVVKAIKKYEKEARGQRDGGFVWIWE